ncbi:phospholipid-translocating P-type ATPase [Neoconidiobolus thromboides FSU 785]|nr:phospholipid-translocating P-type ATPase [Neoconidiobolus thromboides FSU 785]
MTMVKDGYEDYNRYLSDKEENNRKTNRIIGWRNVNVNVNDTVNKGKKKNIGFNLFQKKNKETEVPLMEYEYSEDEDSVQQEKSNHINNESNWDSVLWSQVQVGDLLMVKNEDSIPADLLILTTSEKDGTCFIETKNLDGETNLKVRHSLKSTINWNLITQLKNQILKLNIELPNVNLYSFNGNLDVLNKNEEIIKSESINSTNLLLRGCKLKNVNYIIGLVLYTGHDSKIVLNSGSTPSKKSYIEKMMNKQVIINFVILILLSLSVSIIGGIYVNPTDTSPNLFIYQFSDSVTKSASITGILGFFTSLILFQNIVPISLYLTVEVVKSIQAYFIRSDIEMYDPKLDKLCEPRAWNLSDDLGQIEYIFSDKTGTLTQNIMQFKQCTINGIQYGQSLLSSTTKENNQFTNNENDLTLNNNSASEQPLLNNSNGETGEEDKSSYGSDQFQLDLDLVRIMGEERDRFCKDKYRSGPITFIDPQFYNDLRNNSSQHEKIHLFFKILALCHTVLVELDSTSSNITYKAESPDDAALVSGATNCGFTFLSRFQDKVEVALLGQIETYQLLHVLEFNSTRKRMSILLKDQNNQIFLYCKGADSIILERLKQGQQDTIQPTLNHLKAFAQLGLRTLCIAYRPISNEEFEQWDKRYNEANLAMEEREEKIMSLQEEMEKELILVGGTAIEDKLQENVPESIQLLREAGIKLWVLTGDKTETAINIGFSCNLLTQEMQLVSVTGDSENSVKEQLELAIDQFTFLNHPDLALIIDGTSLKFGLSNEVKGLLLTFAKQCKVVICCRVSPLQKAQVVTLVKEGLNAMCLAIGDGANDVSMIQAAHIGVGISGLEGCQAVMASDYAIGQFQYLTRLLLVHGRWSYIRISHMILCFFYKNLVMTLTNFFFQWFNGPSQTFLFDYTLVLFYNLVFTAFPIMILGAFDQDVNAEVAMVTPQLYFRGIKHMEYSHKRFFMVLLDATFQSIICFFVPYAMFAFSTFDPSGLSNNSLDGFGTTVSACVVVTVNIYVGLWTFNWSFLMYLVIIGSIVIYFVIVLVLSHIIKGMHSVDSMLFASIEFWLVLILCLFCCLLPRYLARYLRSIFSPKDIEVIREQVYLFYNYLKRKKKQLRKKKRQMEQLNQSKSQATANGNSISIGRLFSLKNNQYTSYTGYAFSMDDESVLSQRLKDTMLKRHLKTDQDLNDILQSTKKEEDDTFDSNI